METRKVFKTGHSIAITIPQNMGFSTGDNITFSLGENNTLLLTKTVREGDVQQPQPEIIKEPKIIIEREVVIGFVVAMDEYREYSAHPIIGDHEGYFDSSFGNPIYENQKIIGVLPAPQNTFKIWGHTADEDAMWVNLGYEFLGAYAPNWEEIYPEKKREQDKRNSEPVEGDILADAEGE